MRLLLTLASLLALSIPVMAQGVSNAPYVLHNTFRITVFESTNTGLNIIYQGEFPTVEECLETSNEINVNSQLWAVCHQTVKPSNIGA